MQNRSQLRIVLPQPSQAEEMITLRAKLFVEELVLSGVQTATALRHVHAWTLPEHIKNYTATVIEWLANPHMFVRVVCDAGQNVHGLFVASIAESIETSHYVSSIQLAPSIRRNGFGRALFADFASMIGTDIRPIELHVFKNNTPARLFYQQLGFTDTGVRKTERIGVTNDEPGERMIIMLLIK